MAILRWIYFFTYTFHRYISNNFFLFSTTAKQNLLLTNFPNNKFPHKVFDFSTFHTQKNVFSLSCLGFWIYFTIFQNLFPQILCNFRSSEPFFFHSSGFFSRNCDENGFVVNFWIWILVVLQVHLVVGTSGAPSQHTNLFLFHFFFANVSRHQNSFNIFPWFTGNSHRKLHLNTENFHSHSSKILHDCFEMFCLCGFFVLVGLLFCIQILRTIFSFSRFS